MTRYQKILLATDLSDDNEEVIAVAQNLSQMCEAELHVTHVVEDVRMAYSPDSVAFSEQTLALMSSYRTSSKDKLSQLASRLSVPDSRCHLLDGRTAHAIHQLCDDVGIDLVVLGTHGQAGLSLLLGSTASGVLHGSKCDVLAVRVGI